jgi:Flp pilus assembly protein TadG
MTTRTLTRFATKEDGQALVEFALIMPFLLLFLVGIVEFGRAWNEHDALTDATREGARQAAVYDDAGLVTVDSIDNVIKRVLASNHMMRTAPPSRSPTGTAAATPRSPSRWSIRTASCSSARWPTGRWGPARSC